MGLGETHHELRRYLRLSLRIEGRLGDCIPAGEEFKVRFTVANAAPSPTPGGTPSIHFRTARVVVGATELARPAAGSTVWLDLPLSYLRPGEASAVVVEFVALKDLSGTLHFVGGLERVVRAWATADLDLEVLFKLWVPTDAAAGPA